jgi:hypothetical protein
MMYFSKLVSNKQVCFYITEKIEGKLYNAKCKELGVDIDCIGGLFDGCWAACCTIAAEAGHQYSNVNFEMAGY